MTTLQLNNKEYADTSDRHMIEALGILPIWVKEWIIGKMDTPNGTAYFYEAAILALPMPDGKHYITRMD